MRFILNLARRTFIQSKLLKAKMKNGSENYSHKEVRIKYRKKSFMEVLNKIGNNK